jgi:hypothetical protein
MTKIDFDEQSVGEVTADNKPALQIINKGDSGVNPLVAPAIGVVGESETGIGVVGKSVRFAAIWGQSKEKTGVFGKSDEWIGTQGESISGAGVFGHSVDSVGVSAGSDKGIGLFATAKTTAGQFIGNVEVKGNVEVTGDIKLVNADCAEDFDVVDSELKSVEAGTVMVLNEMGSLQPSYQEYDKKVAGIVSGASGYKPGLILDRRDEQSQNKKDRLPIALMGKVYCKVDARNSSIEMGDLLTTSPTKGFAMKAEDPTKAFGAVIGKALGSIKEGMGMIPVLVALQ